MEKEITLESGDLVKLMLWDTAGQEMFSKLTRAYYKGAGAAVFVFSTVDRESFLEIESWHEKVLSECGEDIVRVLVQNKTDLLDQAQMTSDEVESLARRLKIKLYRCCVKDNVLVDDVFRWISKEFVHAGGSAAFGVDAVQTLDEVSSAAAQAASVSTNAPAGSGAPAATIQVSSSSSGSSSASQPSAASAAASPARPRQVKSDAFKLEPLTRRTGGKKSSLSWCSIM